MKTSYRLTWIAAPRPPAHPNSMMGRQDFTTFEHVVSFCARLAPDAEIMSLKEIQTTEIDVTEKLKTFCEGPSA